MKQLTPVLIDSFMAHALELARAGARHGEVPVGAVIGTSNGDIIAAAHNLTESNHDPAAHAEVLVVRSACEKVSNWRLNDQILCVTLEPCPMCISLIRLARIPIIIYGAEDPRLGSCGSLFDLSQDERWGLPVPQVIRGVQANQSKALLDDFFSKLR